MSDDIPHFAKVRAAQELNAENLAEGGNGKLWCADDWSSNHAFRTVARLIAKHEQPPIDPLLVMAREAAAREYEKIHFDVSAAGIREAKHDNEMPVQSALTALRMAQEQGLPE